MEGWFTPNFEGDADEVAPILAKLSGSASALYLWLHSRSVPCGNEIGISQDQIAKKLGLGRKSVHRAAVSLADAGLIRYTTKAGNCGGTVFSLVPRPELALRLAGEIVKPKAHSLDQFKGPSLASKPDAPDESNWSEGTHNTDSKNKEHKNGGGDNGSRYRKYTERTRELLRQR